MIRLYIRVLELLGRKQARLGSRFGNLALAVAQFAEPVLFGRIVRCAVETPSDAALAPARRWTFRRGHCSAHGSPSAFSLSFCSALVATACRPPRPSPEPVRADELLRTHHAINR